MLTRSRLLLTLTSAVGLVALGAVVDSAAAGCDSDGHCSKGGAKSSGQQVTVQVSGSTTTSGSKGSTGSTASSVSVYSPCSMTALINGKEMFHAYDGHVGDTHGPNGVKDTPPPGWKKHKNDTKGQWYTAACFMDPKYDKFIDDFFKKNATPIFVAAGQQPPVPDVPPEVLRDAAIKAMDVPTPTFSWNPHVKGAASVVNLDTWFWTNDDVNKGAEVTASIPGHSATVNVSLNGVTYSSPNGGSKTCADGGKAWSPGATSDCSLTFTKATPGEPVSASANWTGTWSYDGTPQGGVDIAPTAETHPVPVIEVQSVVSRVD